MKLAAATVEQCLADAIEPAYRLACGMLHDSASAEDAVQEAAIKAWRKQHRLRPGTDLRPWFLGIVANECREHRRRRWTSVLRWAEVPAAAAALGVDLDARRT